MDSPNRDKEKTIYCAETENMDSVSTCFWMSSIQINRPVIESSLGDNTQYREKVCF